jgi:hypothetical protein
LETVDHRPASDGKSQSNEDTTFFFGKNPYAGLRVRQSGTVGNNLYVKNRWIVGEVFSSSGSNAYNCCSSSGSPKNEKSAGETTNHSNNDDDEDGIEVEQRGKRRKGSSAADSSDGKKKGKRGNTAKRKNPALI